MIDRPFHSFPLSASQWAAQARAMAAMLPVAALPVAPPPVEPPLSPEEEEMLLW